MVEHIWEKYIGMLHFRYADDFRVSGAVAHLKPSIVCIDAMGHAHGFFIKPEKSHSL